jgi:3-hydroxyisobutyrate dehydrogenase-like beta-hydroxyacid dehydrogenase
VGIVGLGLMGAAIAGRLVEAQFSVFGFDIDPDRLSRMEALGVKRAASAREIADRCHCIVLAVFDTLQVEQVIEELLPAGAGRSLICTTTCDPKRMERIAAHAAEHGSALIEFPISGTSEQLRSGEALGLLGGPTEAIDGARDVLAAICERRFPVGAAGNAGRAKLAVNLVLQLNRAALAEGLVFAERMGLDPRVLLALLRASPARSEVMDAKGEKMLRRDYAPESRIAQTLKDAQLMLAEAKRLGQRLPLMEVNAVLLAAATREDGERDSAAVIEAIRASSIS